MNLFKSHWYLLFAILLYKINKQITKQGICNDNEAIECIKDCLKFKLENMKT